MVRLNALRHSVGVWCIFGNKPADLTRDAPLCTRGVESLDKRGCAKPNQSDDSEGEAV